MLGVALTAMAVAPAWCGKQERRARDMNLLREACRFVEKYEPELVLSENVAGIVDPKYGGVWEDFRRNLDRIGYATGSKIVCTSRFGIPQFRKRSILMAARRDLVRAARFADILQQELLVPSATRAPPGWIAVPSGTLEDIISVVAGCHGNCFVNIVTGEGVLTDGSEIVLCRVKLLVDIRRTSSV